MRKHLFRANGTRWCAAEISVEDGRLSITGSEGRIVSTGTAKVDGEYHGLDVHKEEDGRVYLLESCGQIREDLQRWFPQLVPLFPWHLNDMHAECEHQEARGETWSTHPNAECPDCGYTLGSAWKRRELPAEVLAAVEAL